MDELEILRKKIDVIDQSILGLLSKRLSLVSKIGKIKNKLGLLIYSPKREKMIIFKKREEAKSLGVSPNLIEDIMRRIMRESYFNESKCGFKTLHPDLRSIVIIGGKGCIGKFFGKMLFLSGYKIKILDREDWENAKSILSDPGMVLVSVPICEIVNVFNKLSQLPKDCILVDLSSIKQIPLETMLKIHTGPVLGIHPMFSPSNFDNNMIKKDIVYCNGRYPEEYAWFLEQMKLWGANLYCSDSISHDQYMGFIQVLCHFINFNIGYNLFEENIAFKKVLSFSSPIFRLQLIIVGRLFFQNPKLYLDIMMSSKRNIFLIKRFYKRFGEILLLLEKNNEIELINQFNKVRSWFGEIYMDLFFKKSSNILEYINDMKE